MAELPLQCVICCGEEGNAYNIRSPLEGLTGAQDSVWSADFNGRPLLTRAPPAAGHSPVYIPRLSNSTMCMLIETFMTHKKYMTVDFCCYCLCELMSFLTICVTCPCLVRCVQWTMNGFLPHLSLARCHPVVCCAFIQVLSLYFALLIHSYPCHMYLCIMYVFLFVCV